jgi:hypothetical protein
MKRFIVISLLTMTAFTVALGQTNRSTGANNRQGSVRDTLMSLERQLWEAWKNKDGNTYQRLLSADSIGVGRGGVDNRAAVIRGITGSDCVVRSYSFDNAQVSMLNPNTAILTFRAMQDATCEGQVIPAMVWATSVYVRRNGRWQAAFHQETPATPITSATPAITP